MSGILVEAAFRVPGLSPYVRVVLAALADRAKRHDPRSWPSVGRIAKDTCISEREVWRSLKALRKKKLIKAVGTSKHGTTIYLLNLVPALQEKERANDLDLSSKSKSLISPKGENASDSQAEGDCQSVTSGVTNGQTKQGKEQQKGNKETDSETSAADAVLAPAQEAKTKTGSGKQVGTKTHSKLVQAWLDAHEKAKIPAPKISGEVGKQLNLLVNGGPQLSYDLVHDALIPEIVSRWSQLCQFATGKGVHLKSGAPMPPQPESGFLLTHKMLAVQFIEMESDALKVYGESSAHGPLPKAIPKPKNWNTKKWSGHVSGKAITKDKSSISY